MIRQKIFQAILTGILPFWLLSVPGQVAGEHIHVYDRCLCSCGEVEFQDEDDRTVILTEQDWPSFSVSGGQVTIPEQVEREGKTYTVVGLGPSLFREHTEVISVICPDTLRYIGRWCFDGCTSLKTINLPDSVERIELAAFQLCTSLESIALPESLTYLGNFAYNHCTSAKNTEIQIPASLVRIGDDPKAPAHTFYDCGKDGVFTRFVVADDNPVYRSMGGILYTKDGETLVSIPRGKVFQGQVYELPHTVRYLGELSFSRNQSASTLILSDSMIIDAYQTLSQKAAFVNLGNDLSIACYGYSGISYYQAKETNPYYTTIDGLLYNKEGTRLIAIPMQYKGVVDIPEGVICWCKDALSTDVTYFKDQALDQITEIRIPESLRVIEEGQIEAVNLLVDQYGTKITVAEGNPMLQTDSDGHLRRR